MTGKIRMTRRGFIASSIAAPFAAKSFASPHEMRFMRLAFVRFPNEPDRVEFEFSNDKNFKLVERYRLFAHDLSLIHIPSPRDKRQSRMPSSA